MKTYYFIFIFSIPFLLASCNDVTQEEPAQSTEKAQVKSEEKINGADLEMPNTALEASSLAGLNSMNVNWIGVIPYGYTRKDSSTVNYDYPFQWWGEKPEGVVKTIQLARSKGMKIMLKPHVWISGEGWPGEFKCESDETWKSWEDSYYDYIMKFAEMADSLDVEVFCIGTEYRIAVRDRPQFWERLIDSVRVIYNGKITYAANWDNYGKVTFWSKLDFIGIDAYFPITEAKHPKPEELKHGFEKLSLQLEQFSDSCDRQILFTEYGFRSLDYSTSGYYKYQVDELSTNPELQADAYQAFLSVFWKEPWIKGGFFWKYQFRSESELGGIKNNRYTPQFKPAQKVVSRHYSKFE